MPSSVTHPVFHAAVAVAGEGDPPAGDGDVAYVLRVVASDVE